MHLDLRPVSGKPLDLIVADVALLQQHFRQLDALVRLFQLLSTVLWREHPLPERSQRLLQLLLAERLLIRRCIAEIRRDCLTAHAALDHRRGSLLDSGDITRGKNPRDGCRAGLIAGRNVSAARVRHLHAVHLEQLRHRRETNCHADGVDIEMLLRPRDELVFCVNLRDCHAPDTVRPLCLLDRVGEIKRYAASGNLAGMDAVPADPRRGIHQRHNLTARLHQLIGDHQADIAGTQHQNPVARLDMVKVHHRLCGAGADDTRKRPAAEVHHVLGCPCCDQDRVRLVVMNLCSDLDLNLLFPVQTDDGRIEHNLDAFFLRFPQKLLADPETADLRHVLLGAEELMNLLEKLSARTGIFIKDRHRNA